MLLAGNGHVRRDIGVPHWLGTMKNKAFVVGYLEIGDDSTPVAAFDAVARTAAAERADPCEEFKRRAPTRVATTTTMDTAQFSRAPAL